MTPACRRAAPPPALKAARLLGAAALAAWAAATPAAAQDPAPYRQQKKNAVHFAGDALSRYEWTRGIPDEGAGTRDESRWRLQARPRLELSAGPFEAAVGGEFNYSGDENDRDDDGVPPGTIRDNYRSRDARLDLAYGRLKLGPVSAQGGRFFMPLPLTEMIWDRDLRPQGGAGGVVLGGEGGVGTRFAATGIYAKGSHVYQDESVMYGGGVELRFSSSPGSHFQVAGSYLEFADLDRLEPAVRRQNTRLAEVMVHDYRVVDLVARLTLEGQFPMMLVADYCWNTALDAGNRGLWLSAVLGSTEVSRARAEYTYAKIDRDATVAAFNGDDFFWNTGWEGHRADLSTAAGGNSTLHGIAQWQRFKDSPDPLQRDGWVTRYRVELRARF